MFDTEINEEEVKISDTPQKYDAKQDAPTMLQIGIEHLRFCRGCVEHSTRCAHGIQRALTEVQIQQLYEMDLISQEQLQKMLIELDKSITELKAEKSRTIKDYYKYGAAGIGMIVTFISGYFI